MATGRIPRSWYIVVGLLLVLTVVPLWPVGEAAAATSRHSNDEELDRAIGNGGQSPDRVIVVYERGTGATDSRRQHARQQVTSQGVEATEGSIDQDIVR